MYSKIILSIIIEQFLVLLILLLHLSGFMNVSRVPVSYTNSSSSQSEKIIENSEIFKGDEKLSSKTIILIIDALRVDHLVSVEKPLMNYSSHLMKAGHGVGYLIKTASPTVTLPRIKSIITGSIPKFMDVIFNFASKEILEENIISSSYNKGMKINFYGDETWLKLFPKSFHKWEGVTSFFVSDYTEVDNNVTRNFPNLFSKDDWDILVLHYLGLDHIGHLEGPKSSLIAPKLQEMDKIIERIHQYLQKKGEPYLFMICGDHGMSDIGGHGGDSHSEIWTSALVISNLIDSGAPGFYSSPSQRIRSQVDLASTLALHLGVPIPVKNIGIPLYELLEVFPIDKQLSSHYRVSKQLIKLAMETQDESNIAEVIKIYDQALKHHMNAWLKTPTDSAMQHAATLAINQYKKFEMLISSLLTENMESYDLPLLLFSSVILIMISLPTIIWTLFLSTDFSSPIYEWKMILVTSVGAIILGSLKYFNVPSPTPSSYIVVVLLIYGVRNLFSFVKCFTTKFQLKVSDWSTIKSLIIIGVLLHPFSLLATSFVEEEHFEFYFFISVLYFTFLATLSIKMIHYTSTDEETTSDNLYPYADTKLINYPLDDPVLFKAERRFYLFVNGKKENGIILHSNNQYKRYISLAIFLSFGWILFRLMRSFNATGDKWKDLIHLNDFLRETEGNELYFSIILGLSIAFLLYKSYIPGLLAVCALAIFGRHFPFIDKGIQSGIIESQLAYICILLYIFYNVSKVTFYNLVLIKKNIYDHPVSEACLLRFLLQILEAAFAFLFLLLQKPENVLVSALCILHTHLIIPVLIQYYSIFNLVRTEAYVIAFWIAHAHYFTQGNSNSFSTVQINSGFVGLTSYQPFLHGVLIVCHTFGARFLVFLHTLVCVLFLDDKIENILDCLRTWWMLQLLTLTVYVINVTLQRHHLFIWSVFAPKLLYEESHFVCLTILTVIIFILYRIAKVISR